MWHSLFLMIFFISSISYDTMSMETLPNDTHYTKDIIQQYKFLSTLNTIIKSRLVFKEIMLSIPEQLHHVLIPHHPYNNHTAYIRYTPHDAVGKEETLFVKKRKKQVKKTLECILGIPINKNEVPTIATCFSGGGFRSMILTLGFLQGMQEEGILDTITYAAGLSGSTWALAPWIASNQTLNTFKQTLSNNISNGLIPLYKPLDLKITFQEILAKLMYHQKVSSIDIYGPLLTNTLMKNMNDKKLELTLSQAHQSINPLFHPFPIYTAIMANANPYEWMEFNPYEIGSSYLQSYIPTWAFGRKFKGGVSTNSAKEQTLGYYMGIFGSAYSVNFYDAMRHTIGNMKNIKEHIPSFLHVALKKCVSFFLSQCALEKLRFFPSKLPNFSYKMSTSPLRKEKKIVLVDAGIDFNLPFPPLLRQHRNIDIIIIYDGSSSLHKGKQLYHAQQYAKRKNIPFPQIDYTNIDKKLVSIFSEPGAPTIIYFPCIKNEHYSPTFDPASCIHNSYCNTLNFSYKAHQIEELSGLAIFTLKEYSSVIKETIKQVIQSKSS